MFIGHFSLGLAAKKVSPKPSLGTLFLAAQFVDLLWPFLLLLGWESVQVEPGNTEINLKLNGLSRDLSRFITQSIILTPTKVVLRTTH